MKYIKRINLLVEAKNRQTKQKLDRLGARDEDDYGCVVPPEDFKFELPIKDENGSFSGAYAWGKNFRHLMECHPVYVDPNDALAGRWMFMLSRMRQGYRLELSNFAFDYSHLKPNQHKYDITCGIGKDAHFAPDYRIGLELGWGGLLDKVKRSLESFAKDPIASELLEAEIDAIEGVQNWILRTAETAHAMASEKNEPELRENLEQIAKINKYLVNGVPETFREACQWIAWFNMASRTYNRDGAGGQLDELLRPYYERDKAKGMINDCDVEFYIACLLLNDPHYYQLGGPDRDGNDMTSPLSFIILEAASKLKVSCNLTIRVHKKMDKRLFRRGVEILLKDKLGYPRFSGDKALVEGFCKNGYSEGLARERIATGCNWMSLPGMEYTLNDVVKINIAKVFEVAFYENMKSMATLKNLQELFARHFEIAIETVAEGMDFHLEHQYLNEPELMLNLLSYGPIEKGLDMSHGGAKYYNMALDCAGLATVADSFAALEQRVEKEKILSWQEVEKHLSDDFSGRGGERVRRMLAASEKYGQGNSLGDNWARWLNKIFVEKVALRTTPKGRKMIPGWFSWADSVRFGKNVGATPNGRKAAKPISHGANPCPGFRKDNALTAMSNAIASIQPGYGNSAPWQLELDIGSTQHPNAVDNIIALLQTHFDIGGTLVNINIVDAATIIRAHEKPEDYPYLIVRVTGFSAYFTSLSKDFRQLVVDRIIES